MTARRPLVQAHGCVRRANPAAWVKRGKGCTTCQGFAARACGVVDGGRKATPGREAH